MDVGNLDVPEGSWKVLLLSEKVGVLNEKKQRKKILELANC